MSGERKLGGKETCHRSLTATSRRKPKVLIPVTVPTVLTSVPPTSRLTGEELQGRQRPSLRIPSLCHGFNLGIGPSFQLASTPLCQGHSEAERPDKAPGPNCLSSERSWDTGPSPGCSTQALARLPSCLLGPADHSLMLEKAPQQLTTAGSHWWICTAT